MSKRFTERAPFPDETDRVAGLINEASSGLVSYLLDGILPGFQGESLLSAALMQGDSAYTLDSMLLLEDEAGLAGFLFAYPAERHVVHPAMTIFASAAKIEAARPLLALSIPGSLHINTLWVRDGLDGDDAVWDLLLRRAAEKAVHLGLPRLCLCCYDSEERLLRFLEGQGFVMEKRFSLDPALGDQSGGGRLLCKTLEI